MSRYDGKPLLRLLDSYVLWCIGELPPATAATLEQMEPQLASSLGHAGRWYEIIEATAGLDPSARVQFREMWANNQRVAAAAGTTLSPDEFAIMCSDKNFVPLFDWPT